MARQPYRQYFDATPGYVTVQDRDFRITDANRRVREDFGDVLGRHCYQIYQNRPKKCDACPVDLTFQDGQVHSSQEQITALNGKEISVAVQTSPIRDEAGEIVAVLKASTEVDDIAEVKTLRKELQRISKDARKLFNAVPCYISVQDRTFRIIASNNEFKRQFGECEGRYCYGAYKGRDTMCPECPVKRSFADGQVHTSEEKVFTRDGREIHMMVSSRPIRDDFGEIEAVMEVSTDITALKVLQEELQRGQEEFESLFDTVPCYITVQDRQLRLQRANQRFRDDFGDFLGRHCYKVYKHRGEECYPCPVQETLEDGQVHSSEEVVKSRNGELMNVLVYTAPIYGPDGEIKSVMEMSTDISSIRQLQSQLESIGLLIGSISHSVKGLLTGLDGGRYLVDTGMAKNDPNRVKRGWEMVQRNVDRIRDTVFNILYYTKERELKWEQVSASELLNEVSDLMEPKARQQNVGLRRDLDGSVGQIECDRRAIRALLVNLAENALDACRVDKKKAEHQVTIGARGFAEHVEFEIRDNGIGMDQETKEKAFSLFFSSKGAEGTGLGLFVANNIVHAHGGSIQLEGQLDMGTQFTVRIPRTRQTKPPPYAASGNAG